ncbi:MAG: translation initiation factor IF-3 [Patescibacteria group bacterium]
MRKRIFLNNQIRARDIRLIDETGKQVGVIPLPEALRIARERNFDLIQVTERVEPPVCKLGDYGKYLYQQEKKEKATKKHVGGELKEVRLTYMISDHDLGIRVMQAEKFLQRGDRVRITLPLRGREKALAEFARQKVERFLEMLKPSVSLKVERELKREPRGLSMIVAKQ